MKKKLNTIITLIMASISFVTIAVTALYLFPNSLENVSAKQESYTLDIGGKNGGEWSFLSNSGYKNSKHTYRYVDMAFDYSFKNQNNNLQLQKSFGTVYNLPQSPITGLFSLKVDYTSKDKLLLHFGNSAKPNDEIGYAIESGQTYNLSKFSNYKYFSIHADRSYAEIDKISLTYLCREVNTPLYPDELYPVKLSVQQNKTDYPFGSKIDFEKDLVVSVLMNDNSEKIVHPYDASSNKNGYRIADILSDKHGEISNLPQPFNEIDTYLFYIYYKENGLMVNDDSGVLMSVVGGSATSIAPTNLEITNNAPVYQIGDTFNPNAFIVMGNWPDYGGLDTIIYGDGDNGYSITSSQDLSKPFDKEQTFEVTISYRGLSQNFNIKVTAKLDKTKIDYNYNDYGRDQYYNTDIMSTMGSPKTLVVPIWFTDSSNYINETEKVTMLDDIQKAYFGTPEDTGWESVTSYYEKDSYNQLHIQGEVTTWMNVDLISYKVTQDMTLNLVIEASKWAKQFYTGEEWKQFDTDKNGYLDAIILIYGAPDYLTSQENGTPQDQINDNLWAYCYWVQKLAMNVNNPQPNVYFWASYDFMYQDNSLTLDTHTYIHEMGHILGLPDYYDVAGANKPAGDFSMQDMNVGGHDPMSKMTYGWCDPFVPTGSTTITIKDFDSSGELILLSPNFTGSAFDEYILLEYFTPTGLNYRDTHVRYLDRYPNATLESGLRVWHCDQRLFAYIPGTDTPYNKTFTRYEEGLDGMLYQMSNTTYFKDEGVDGYCPELPEYRNYDNLALLNHSYTSSKPYNFNKTFGAKHLWQLGDSFDMQTYASSFPKPGKLNSGLDLGFSFTVTDMNSTSITVSIIKQ